MHLCIRLIGLAVIGTLMTGAAEGAAPPRPRPNNYNQQRQRQTQQYQNAFRQAQYRSALANMQRAQQMAMMNYMRSLAALYGNGNGLGGPGTGGSFTDYRLVPSDDVVVRWYRLPPKDPTDPKAKYTTEELAQLKGDDKNLIGYTAAFDDLKEGQTIRCTQAVKRTDPKDPDKVSYVASNTVSGKLQKLEANSLKEFVVRVRGAATGTAAYAMQPQQRRPNGNNNNNANNNAKEVAPDNNKVVTLIVIYNTTEGPAMTAKTGN
jgi:hypothetical protein